MADPRFVLVKSVSPHNGGNFRRAGLRFTRDWRPLEIAAKPDLDKGVIDDEVLKVLQAETFLAVKPASAEEVARLADARLDASRDKDSELAELRTKNAELEARLMRLEVGGKQPGTDPELDMLRTKNAELEAKVAALGDLEARLKRLETAPAAGAGAPTAPTTGATPPTAPATDKSGKPAAAGK
jgi:hypothetical protein